MKTRFVRSCSPIFLLALAAWTITTLLAWRTATVSVEQAPWIIDYYYNDLWRLVPLALVLAVVLPCLIFVCRFEPDRSSWQSRWIARVGGVCSAGLFVLCALAGVRTAHHTPLDRFLQRLSQGAQEIPCLVIRTEMPVPVVNSLVTKSNVHVVYLPGPLGRRVIPLSGLSVIQECEKQGCRLLLVENADEFLARFPTDSTSSSTAWSAGLVTAPHQEWGDAFKVAKDPEEPSLYLKRVRSRGDPYLPRLSPEIEYRVLRDGQYQPATFDPASITSRTGPPATWLGLAILGLGAISILFGVRRRVSTQGSAARLNVTIAIVAALSGAPLLGAAFAKLLF